MSNLPHRTNATSLSNDELVLLDVVFSGDVSFELLRRDAFHLQWNLGYAHDLSDIELREQLRRLCERHILATEDYPDCTRYSMTPIGGDLWSQERCPVWDRYCIQRNTTTRHDNTRTTVVAVSPEVRDHFLALCPGVPLRQRTVTIPGNRLLSWRLFPQLYAGLATYYEDPEWTFEEYLTHREPPGQSAMVERERSWWETVRDLQKFLPNAGCHAC